MPIYDRPRALCSGGYALYLELCNEISLDCNRRVHALYYAILSRRSAELECVEEAVPAYSSLTLFYDPRRCSCEELVRRIESVWSEIREVESEKLFKPQRFRIPVLYGGEYGPDLQSVAELTGLSPEEVVEIHSSRPYVCYMLGFTPGFVYLGDVDERIAVPRLPTPRTRIPAGSVGIAGKQTGVYGVESPGGWRLIGRTPLKMFDPSREPPIPIRPGDVVEFYPIDEDEFRKLKGVFVGDVTRHG